MVAVVPCNRCSNGSGRSGGGGGGSPDAPLPPHRTAAASTASPPRILMPMATSRFILPFLAFLALLMATAGVQSPGDLERFEFTRLLMGVDARVILYAENEESARSAAAAALDRIAELESIMSDYRSDSELSQLPLFAAQGGGAVRVSEDLFEVLERAQEIAQATDGAFDITMGPLTKLWRQMRRDGRAPSDEAREEALARSGWRNLVLDQEERTVLMPVAGMELDLGGIGKGFAAQEAVNLLKERGMRRCLVAIGGDIVVGEAPPGLADEVRGWRIATDLGLAAEETVLLENAAISTSSGRQQFVEVGGVRLSHIIDPRTGLGSTRNIGVTVQAADGAIADALGTALMLVDSRAAAKLLARFPGAEVTIVRYTEGGAERIRVEDLWPEYPLTTHNQPPPGFAAVFSGRDLSGWKGLAGDPPVLTLMSPQQRLDAQRTADTRMRRHWSVQDGELVFDGLGDSLQTIASFADFELLLDWKIQTGGDSGVYLRGVPQVQIWDDSIGSGGLYNNQEHPSRPLKRADRPPGEGGAGEWNRFRIVMRDDAVSVWLNDELVVDAVPLENYWDRGAPLPAAGPIELQAHGTPLRFRNIFIRGE
jgi:FAD:protein FMN transferase